MNGSRNILVGFGAFAREVLNWSEDVVNAGQGNSITCFIDDNPDAATGFGYDLIHLGSIQSYTPASGDLLIMAIGDPLLKKSLFIDLKRRGASFAQLVHPTAVVAKTAKLGEGVIVCPQAVVSADTQIGDVCAINCCSTIGHDVKLGSYSTLSGHVDLTGWVEIGECVFFGSGARVLPSLKIGSGSRVGAGAVVMRSAPPGTVLYSHPAKRL